MRTGNNLEIKGGGLHHVAVGATDFERSRRFYTEGLGFREVLRFPENDRTVALLDAGDGTYLELFAGRGGENGADALLHFALRTDDCDAAAERARAAGAEITTEPTDMVLEGEPAVPVRYAFAKGPNGEKIEFMQSEEL